MLRDPRMLELLIAGDRIEKDVVHPEALFRSAQNCGAEAVAGDVHAQIASQVPTQQGLVVWAIIVPPSSAMNTYHCPLKLSGEL